KITRLCALQNFVHVHCRAPEYFVEVRRIGHKTTILYILCGRIHRRQPVFRRESDDFFAVSVGESVPDRDKSFGVLARCGSKSSGLLTPSHGSCTAKGDAAAWVSFQLIALEGLFAFQNTATRGDFWKGLEQFQPFPT